jgi:hypothetical protein
MELILVKLIFVAIVIGIPALLISGTAEWGRSHGPIQAPWETYNNYRRRISKWRGDSKP